MSFTPISGGFSTALSGAVEPTKFLSDNRLDTSDDIRLETRDLYGRKIHSPSENKYTKIKYTIVIVILSAIIFVTVIAIYDVLRNAINNYYANIALNDTNSHNTPEDIQRTTIANENALWSSMIFATVCIITAIILILIIIYYLL
jgi:ABC-type Fe3+ transport system permease subunit